MLTRINGKVSILLFSDIKACVFPFKLNQQFQIREAVIPTDGQAILAKVL